MAKLNKSGESAANGISKLNAATRRAIFSFGILVALFILFSVISGDKFLAQTFRICFSRLLHTPLSAAD